MFLFVKIVKFIKLLLLVKLVVLRALARATALLLPKVLYEVEVPQVPPYDSAFGSRSTQFPKEFWISSY